MMKDSDPIFYGRISTQNNNINQFNLAYGYGSEAWESKINKNLDGNKTSSHCAMAPGRLYDSCLLSHCQLISSLVFFN